MKTILLCLVAITAFAEEKTSPVKALIPWLLDADEKLEGIPFADVISATSGKRVIPIDRKEKETARIIAGIGKALDSVLVKMNAPDSPIKKGGRVNEMSSHFEDALRAALNGIEGFSCGVPHTTAGAKQRSGYPDLRLVDKATGRILYLDPKLYAKGSRGSSLRTFYFTPRRETNKVNDDANHLIVAFEHDKGSFAHWELVDLSSFKVKLKAEFEGSNRDIYRDDATVAKSVEAK